MQTCDDTFEVLLAASHDQQLTAELDVDLHALDREHTRPGKLRSIVEASPSRKKLSYQSFLKLQSVHLRMVAFVYAPFFPLIPSPGSRFVDPLTVSSRTWRLLPPRCRRPSSVSPLALMESDQVVTRKAAGGLSGQILLNCDTRRSRSYGERFDVVVSATDGPIPR